MEKMLSNIKFLKDNDYINDLEYNKYKTWILEEKYISEQDYLELISCWMIEGLITKKEYFNYIKVIWNKDLVTSKRKDGNYIYLHHPGYSKITFFDVCNISDNTMSLISIFLFLITVILVLWLINVII
ncbi:hypothetical protein RJG79_10360 [Mycoplasmatota bacterium WC44]